MMFLFLFFFFNDTATTEIYTLSLHDALPISLILSITSTMTPFVGDSTASTLVVTLSLTSGGILTWNAWPPERSEEHTSELQSRPHLVCRLLLEKKKITADLYCFVYYCTSSCD